MGIPRLKKNFFSDFILLYIQSKLVENVQRRNFNKGKGLKVHLHLRISAMNTLKNLDVIMF